LLYIFRSAAAAALTVSFVGEVDGDRVDGPVRLCSAALAAAAVAGDADVVMVVVVVVVAVAGEPSPLW
jgi:hypothetical protein